MRVLATLDADGLPTGFYPDDIFPEGVGVPPSAIELTVENYIALRDGHGTKRLVAGAVVDHVPAPPPVVMPSLSPTQLALGLRREGVISTLDDTINFAAAGKIPAELLSMLEGIPDQQQREDAIVRVAAATSYDWNNTITQFVGAKVGAALGWSDETFRAKWLEWSQL